MNFDINHQQLGNQSDSDANLQLPDVAASCPIIASPNSQNIECVKPMTFSQKLYQSQAQEIAEEFEEALEANSLESMRKLLNKVLELDWATEV